MKDDGTDTKEGTVDGKGTGVNTNNMPLLRAQLTDGFPYVSGKGADGSGTIEGSMSYLFAENNTYHQKTMVDGGGLFQKDKDGYYYYDSAKNSAYFDGTTFTLYDTVVRPGYTAIDGSSDIQRSNFLPFNEVEGAVTVDTELTTGVPAAKLNNPVDLWFGMTVEFDFYMPKDGKMNGEPMIFDFHGDDDVFVYIDDVLVLNIIGTHAAQSATIDFSTGIAKDVHPAEGKTAYLGSNLKEIFEAAGKNDVLFDGNTFADYTKHTLKFFYMERGGNISYCRLRFNMPILPNNSLTVTKEVEAEAGADAETVSYIKDSLEYQFRVWKADENGNSLEKLFIEQGDTFDILENSTKVDEGIVGAEGLFTLKTGQSAQFTEMLTKSEGHKYYIVEEGSDYGLSNYDHIALDGNSVTENDVVF